MPDLSHDELHRIRRVAFLHGVMKALTDEMDRIYAPGRFILFKMIDHPRGKRLLFQADAVLAELCRLEGEPHTPLAPIRVKMPWFHPLVWLVLQWALGIWNAYCAIDYALAGRWGLAVFYTAALIACTRWAVPTLRLALKGKWHA